MGKESVVRVVTAICQLAFFWEFFHGGKSIVMQISIVILLFLDQISGRGKSFQGAAYCLRGAPPAPLVEESQSVYCICSDPNNESDPSSEYSPLGLTHVMNQYLGQKFTTWVKVNCLNTIHKPRSGIPQPCTVHE